MFEIYRQRLALKLAIRLEKASLQIKRKIAKSRLEIFLAQYSLTDGHMKKKTNISFNPYERTNLLLIDELIKSNEIQKEDKIFDVGCGAGIFLIYLSSKGFSSLQGVEIDSDLALLCRNNIQQFQSKCASYNINNGSIAIFEGNALNITPDDDVTCFYLFNTFYDKATYLLWLEQVARSLSRKKRKIKIIILYPTVASMGAMRECSWLYEKTRVLCEAQVCYRCMNFIIYESID